MHNELIWLTIYADSHTRRIANPLFDRCIPQRHFLNNIFCAWPMRRHLNGGGNCKPSFGLADNRASNFGLLYSRLRPF